MPFKNGNSCSAPTKKRIGLLSYSTCTNYGALLQLYALQCVLSRKGYDVSVINLRVIPNNKYLYGTVRNPYVGFGTRIKGLLRYLTNRRFRLFENRFANFVEWRKKFFKLSSQEWRNGSEFCKAPSEMDLLVVGSDQVFNQNNAKLFMCEALSPKIRKISYAASFGDINEETGRTIGLPCGLSTFSKLSVREKTGQALVKTLTGQEVPWVVDPTILSDPDIWDSLLIEVSPPRQGDYLFVYWIGPIAPIREKLVRLSKQTKLPIELYLTIYDKACPLNLPGVTIHWDADPSAFICALKNACLVFSNSFHAMMFSGIFSRKSAFVIADSKERKGSASRFSDIASIMKCENALYRTWPVAVDFAETSHALTSLSEMRQQSIAWLESAIESEDAL